MPKILDAAGIQQRITSLARAVVADTALFADHGADLMLVGIRRRGEQLVARLAEEIARINGCRAPTGALDITMYRDDLSGARGISVPQGTDLDCSLDDRAVVLVDDVLHTGRSVRAALDALVDFGRPRMIRLLVLVDRGGREFPISADFIGEKVQVPRGREVRVLLTPTDAEDAIYLSEQHP